MAQLQSIVCADAACRHELRDHGHNGYCYGLIRRPSGAFVNCVCRKFRMPSAADLQTPPQKV